LHTSQEFSIENRRTAQSSMSAASQIRDAILEKKIANMAVFGYIVGAATDRAHRAQLVLSIVADILTNRYRAMRL